MVGRVKTWPKFNDKPKINLSVFSFLKFWFFHRHEHFGKKTCWGACRLHTCGCGCGSILGLAPVQKESCVVKQWNQELFACQMQVEMKTNLCLLFARFFQTLPPRRGAKSPRDSSQTNLHIYYEFIFSIVLCFCVWVVVNFVGNLYAWQCLTLMPTLSLTVECFSLL